MKKPSNANPGFGLARLKIEGSPMHPDDLDWECDIEVCADCRRMYNKGLKAYNDYYGIKEE